MTRFGCFKLRQQQYGVDSNSISALYLKAGWHVYTVCVCGRLLQVLYHMFSELSEIGEENVVAVDVVLGVVSFFVVVIGSIGIGAVLGLLGSFSARFTHHLRTMEPLVVVMIPYLSFLVAEMFHLSGILAYVQSLNVDGLPYTK